MEPELQHYPEIEIEKIIIPKERAHAILTPEQREELKASIKEHGFRVPIILRKDSQGQFELIDGQNRIEICQELGIKKVPYILCDSDEKKAQILNFQANWIKGFHNPIDVAECLARAKNAGAEVEDLARWTGHTIQWVNRYLTLNDLPDEFKSALREGKIPVGIIWESARLEDPEEIYQTIQTAIDLKWTVTDCANFVDNRLDSLRMAKVDQIEFWPEDFPSREEAEKMARLRTCSFCKAQRDVKEIIPGIICAHCVEILIAASEVASSPEEAAKFIREIIKREKERELYERLKKKFEPEKPSFTEYPRPLFKGSGPTPQQSF